MLSPRPRSTEDKLYRLGLAACIDSIASFAITKKRAAAVIGAYLSALHRSFLNLLTKLDASTTSLEQNNNKSVDKKAVSSPSLAPSSSPPAPSTDTTQTTTSSTPETVPGPYNVLLCATVHTDPGFRAVAAADMNPRGIWNNGPAPPSFSGQDARNGNFAVQPSAAPVKVNLKRPAVKVVRPAGAGPLPASRNSSATAAPMATVGKPAEAIKAYEIVKPKEADV